MTVAEKRRLPVGVLSRNRGFLALSMGASLGETGAQMTFIALPLLVLALTGSAAKAGIVGVARGVAMAGAVIPGGVLADRIDLRRLMIACSCTRLAAVASLPIVLAFGRPPFGQLVAVGLLDATLSSIAFVTERSLLTLLVERSELPEAVTVNEARSAVATLVGPSAGGALFGLARAAPFLGDACTAVVELGALAAIRLPRSVSAADAPPRPGMLAGAVEGFRWLFSQPFLRSGSLLYAAENVTIYAVQLLGLLILHRHGVSSAGIGGAYAIIGAGGLLSAAIANPLRRRMTPRRAVLAEPWAYALLVPLLLLLHSAVTVGLLVALMFLPMTVSTSIIVGTRLQVTPEHLRGRVQASGVFTAVSLSWLGPLAVGLIVQYGGESAATIAVAAWALATALLATASRGFKSMPPVAGEGSSGQPSVA